MAATEIIPYSTLAWCRKLIFTRSSTARWLSLPFLEALPLRQIYFATIYPEHSLLWIFFRPFSQAAMDRFRGKPSAYVLWWYYLGHQHPIKSSSLDILHGYFVKDSDISSDWMRTASFSEKSTVQSPYRIKIIFDSLRFVFLVVFFLLWIEENRAEWYEAIGGGSGIQLTRCSHTKSVGRLGSAWLKWRATTIVEKGIKWIKFIDGLWLDGHLFIWSRVFRDFCVLNGENGVKREKLLAISALGGSSCPPSSSQLWGIMVESTTTNRMLFWHIIYTRVS